MTRPERHTEIPSPNVTQGRGKALARVSSQLALHGHHCGHSRAAFRAPSERTLLLSRFLAHGSPAQAEHRHVPDQLGLSAAPGAQTLTPGRRCPPVALRRFLCFACGCCCGDFAG